MGYPGEGPPAGARPAVVPLVSLNVTAWSTWKGVFGEEANNAQIWMLQEHKIRTGAGIRAAKKEMRAAGWTPVFARAATTAAGSASGGTALLVRDHWDITEVRRIRGPAAHRAVGAVVRLGGLAACVWSIYGDCDDATTTEQLLRDVLEATPTGLEVLVGGDFNLRPQQVQAFLHNRTDLQVWASGQPTCTGSAGTQSELDFFVMTKSLQHCAAGAAWTLPSAVPTHCGVGLSVQLRDAVQLIEWIRPKVPGTTRVHGPMLEVQPGTSDELAKPGE